MMSTLVGSGAVTVLVAPPPAAAKGASQPALVTTGGGTSAKYKCSFNVNTDAFTGAYGTASAIGWEGNASGVTTCLGGSFVVQGDINKQAPR
jgi:hypothetical protein